MVGGYNGRYLKVDLTSGRVKDISVPAEKALVYLGNKGVAARLLYELLPPETDPLSPANVVIVNTGPLTATGAPGSSRFNLTTKSPLTGLIASSNCGGDFGSQLKKAGYDGLIMQGRAEQPVWLEINPPNVLLHDARALWGKGTQEVQEMAPGGKGKLAIGPAGENLVKFALVMSGERALARCGVGAVLGSKNLKGVSVSGNVKPAIHDPVAFKKTVKKWTESLKAHPVTGSMLPEFGTAVLVNRCNAANLLPTCNFHEGHFPEAESISGEELAEKYLVGRVGCTGCPVRCGRVVKHPADPEKKIKGPEYETLALLGSNLCIGSLPHIFEWNYICDDLGMDTVSAGAVLATAMELAKLKALDVGLAFGDPRGVSEMLEKIAYREGVGDLLAEGARRMAEECGHPHLASHARGLELPGYNPRFAFGHGLGYATSNRGGCHLNGGYLAYLEGAGCNLFDGFSTKGKASLTVFMQDLIEAVSAAGGCVFSAFLVLPRIITEKLVSAGVPPLIGKALTQGAVLARAMDYIPRRAFAFKLPLRVLPYPRILEDVTGEHFTFGGFLATGARIFDLERAFNLREGLDPMDDTLSARFVNDDESDVQGRAVPIGKMLPEYYRARHWTEKGITSRPFQESGLGV